MTLRVFSLYGSQSLAAAIDSKNIEFLLATQNNNRVNFTIDTYNPSIPEIKIKVNYSNPKKISNGMDEDILEAVITEDI